MPDVQELSEWGELDASNEEKLHQSSRLGT